MNTTQQKSSEEVLELISRLSKLLLDQKSSLWSVVNTLNYQVLNNSDQFTTNTDNDDGILKDRIENLIKDPIRKQTGRIKVCCRVIELEIPQILSELKNKLVLLDITSTSLEKNNGSEIASESSQQKN